jgi:hypothetical protein
MRWFTFLLLALLTGGGLGCESDKTAPPSETCAKVGDTCKLPNGPLGICNAEPCKPGASPPCLRCTPQH